MTGPRRERRKRRARREAALGRKAFELSPDSSTDRFDIPGVDLSQTFTLEAAPVLFLPVRIETRFFGTELKLRIYPDQIHLDAHDTALTRREVELGQQYWRTVAAGHPEEARAALVERLAPRRALWVARALEPTRFDRDGPEFPKVELRDGPRPAQARLLPARWAVAGFVDHERRFLRFGAAIAEPLAFSPDLRARATSADDDPLAWMFDFEHALAAGMAVSVDLAGFDYGSGGLTLVVVGIGAHSNPREALERQLAAHRYTSGLELVEQGRPTNNTDSTVAGWTARVDDVATLFEREFAPPGSTTVGASATLAAALGLSERTVLHRLAGAERDEDSAMAAMNRALWPATWGGYLGDMLAPDDGESIVPRAKRNAVRDFFVGFVRGGAPLPTLGIGSQPYGILPVMRLAGGDLASSDPLVALEAILLALQDAWRDSLPGVARLDPVDGGTADDAVAEVLGLLPHPFRFVVRELYSQRASRQSLWAGLWGLCAEPDSPYLILAFVKSAIFGSIDSIDEELEWLRDLREEPFVDEADVPAAQTLIDAFIGMCEAHAARQAPFDSWYPDAISGVLDEDVTTDPKIFYASYGDDSGDELFNRPLVSSPHARTAAYLAWLRDRLPGLVDAATPLSTQTEPWGPDRLTRVRGTRRSSANPSAGSVLERSMRDPVPRAESGTLPRDPTSSPPTGGTPGVALPEAFFSAEPLLYQLLDSRLAEVTALEAGAYGAALQTLAGRGDPELELRMRETLGLATHRLDAWLTAFASRVLAELREAGNTELYLGGFGWIEGLRPDARGVRESAGFIHAPSIAHATTAAVLRAGYEVHQNDDPGGAFAFDLRSERVRTAAWLLDGVRQGQGLGDLLGRRFERCLHDGSLDRYIDPCRRRVLEARNIRRAPRGPVDGLALLELYQDGGVRVESPDGAPIVLEASVRTANAGLRALQAALDDLGGALDAVLDATLADSVHHVLMGNTERASATLDSLATGRLPPPELRSLDVRYAGTAISHGLLVTLAAEPETGSWGASPRDALEPALAGFAAELFGDPARAVCDVHVRPLDRHVRVSLAALAGAQSLGALDVAFERLPGLEARARAYVLGQPEFAPYERELAVDMAPETVVGELGFAEVASLAAALRALLGVCRPMDATDLAMPGVAAESRIDRQQAEARLGRFRAGLSEVLGELDALLPEPRGRGAHATEPDELGAGPGSRLARPVGRADLQTLRGAMLELNRYGIGRAPVEGYTASPAGRRALFAQAWSMSAEAGARLAAHDAAGPDAPLAERVQALAGKAFLVLPQFEPQTADRDVFADSGRLLPEGSAAALEWLGQVALVRGNAARLLDLLTTRELVCDEYRFRPKVGQRPVVEGEPWVALGPPGDSGKARLSLWTLDAGGADALVAGSRLAGLVVDGWSESLPASDTVTGVAVNYDSPSARPPQALLLALPPANADAWNLDAFLETLLDTLEAAKLRTVDADVLLGFGHQVPAIFSPRNINSGPQESTDE